MENEHGGVVLLDAEPGSDAQFDRKLLECLDHPVVLCSGPDVKRLCPLLGGAGCEKFERAHGIVFRLDLERPQHRAILRRYEELARSDLPIRVVCEPGQATKFEELLAGVEVWEHEPTVADLDGFAAEVEAVDRYSE